MNGLKLMIFLFAVIANSSSWLNVAHAQAPSPQQTLSQLVAELKQSPKDTVLREKIIGHVQGMQRKPVIPDEADRFMARGAAAIKGAKSEKDFQDAVAEFEKATLAAPWLADGYYNLGVAQDKAGIYAEAIKSYKLYLLTSPEASDAGAVKKLIWEIEYKQEKATKESSPVASAARKQMEEVNLLKKIDHARYVAPIVGSPVGSGSWTLEIQGAKIVQGYVFSRCLERDGCVEGMWVSYDAVNLSGREFTLGNNGFHKCGSSASETALENGRISDDGNTITTEVCNERRTYRRER
jgi:tetratricopeptide (TPR) repeat protein